jgi:hypothetical protein
LDNLSRSELSRLVPLPTLESDGLPVRRGENGLIDAVAMDGTWMTVGEFVGALTDQRIELWKRYAADPRHPAIRRQTFDPCISVALDRRTGELAETHNQLVALQLHPIISARVSTYMASCESAGMIQEWGTPYRHFSVPGTHSEIYAVSELLWRREAAGIPVDDSALLEMRIDNHFPYRGGGKEAPCCANCTAIIPDVPCNAGKFPSFPPNPDEKWPE